MPICVIDLLQINLVSCNMLIGDSKLSLGVNVSVCSCLSHLSLCGPAMDWRPVQGLPCLSPDDCWDRLQHPHDPTNGLSGYRKWIDGITFCFLFTFYTASQHFFLELSLYTEPWKQPIKFLKQLSAIAHSSQSRINGAFAWDYSQQWIKAHLVIQWEAILVSEQGLLKIKCFSLY